MSSKVETPFPIFTDIDGSPLEDGYIYVGTAGLDPSTNGITVYSDTGLSTVVAQPIRTKSGFPVVSGSPIRIYANTDNYSLKVSNKNNSQVLQDLNAGASSLVSLPLSGGTMTGNLVISNGAPEIYLQDTSSNADDFWIHVNNNNFYVLADRDNNGAWDGPDPLQLNTDTNTAYTFGKEIVTLDGSGNLGVGTSSPTYKFQVQDLSASAFASVVSPSSDTAGLLLGDIDLPSIGRIEYDNAVNAMKFFTNSSERMRLDASGNLLVGKTVSGDISADGSELKPDGLVTMARNGGVTLVLNRINNDGDIVHFYGDGNLEGSISVSGTTVSYNGGHLARWSRMLDGSKPENLLKGTVMSNLDEMIDWAYPETPEVLWAAGDGLPEGVSVGDVKVEGVAEVIDEEGNIVTEAVEEVLWQETDGLPEGVQIGDVKVEYKPAGVEDNEQLNHTAISSVEGDRDVAGVFIAWDDDDDYNDYHLAMAGDVIIRIAEGVEVKRGDLLVSAGDGTAKPQDDDLIRSSTVAKVTSTVVSCTYDDGSFCVPCVLK